MSLKPVDWSKLRLVAYTVDGQKVMANCWSIRSQDGLPLEFMFWIMKDHKEIPDWIDLYEAARNHGMKHDRILSALNESIADSYGSKTRDMVLAMLDKVFNTKLDPEHEKKVNALLTAEGIKF